MDETKKYIIEFSEDPHTIRLLKLKNGDKYPVTEFKTVTPYTEPDMEQVKRDYDAFYEHGYEQGLSDAWEAARKIASDNAGQNYSIFGQHFTVEILNTHSASEAIEELRAYEQAQKEKVEMDGLRQNIQTIVDQCGYTLDEITEVLQKMKEA